MTSKQHPLKFLDRLARLGDDGLAPHPTAALLLRRISRALGWKRSEIWLLDAEGKTLSRLAGHGRGRLLNVRCGGIPIDLDRDLARLLKRSERRRALLPIAVRHDAPLIDGIATWARGVGPVVATQLRARGRPFALLCAEPRRGGSIRPASPPAAALAAVCGEVLDRAVLRQRDKGRGRRLKVLHQVCHAIGTQESLPRLLPSIARIVHRSLRCKGVIVGLYHATRDRFEVAGAAGPEVAAFVGRHYRLEARAKTDCLSLRATESEAVEHVTDATPLPRRRTWWPDVRSALAAPIRSQGKVIGFLRLESERPLAFDATDRAVFRILGESIGHAIRRARMMEELHGKQSALRRLSRTLRKALEDERRRFAHELHDEIGQSMTAARLNLALLQELSRDAAPLVRRTLRETERIVMRTQEEARRIAMDLQPRLLSDRGFAPALRTLTRDFSRRTGIRVALRVPPEATPGTPALQNLLYRSVQEGLTNVARHARATRVQVTLAAMNGDLRLTVQDDGVGMRHGPGEATGLGLRGLRHRIDRCGGIFSVRSKPRRGTRIDVRVPVTAAPAGGHRPRAGAPA